MRHETLEEVAESYAKSKTSHKTFQETHKRDFKEGAQWQQEQDKNRYSEEEVLSILMQAQVSKTSILQLGIKQWFSQYIEG